MHPIREPSCPQGNLCGQLAGFKPDFYRMVFVWGPLTADIVTELQPSVNRMYPVRNANCAYPRAFRPGTLS